MTAARHSIVTDRASGWGMLPALYQSGAVASAQVPDLDDTAGADNTAAILAARTALTACDIGGNTAGASQVATAALTSNKTT